MKSLYRYNRLHTPRIPNEGRLDLTYRCNNNCLHCWLKIEKNSLQEIKELSFYEIKSIFFEAKQLGCTKWAISGGEPMIRSDFIEIFDFISKNAKSYSLNTNGTLINREIALLMKKKGKKMISIYGATSDVHDSITQHPGSFEATMNGIRILKEVGAGFTVQIVPMKSNYHQMEKMISLAKYLSPHYKMGASWLYLSADQNQAKNKEIRKQRLSPKHMIQIDNPDMFYEDVAAKINLEKVEITPDDRLFLHCIPSRRVFHIDPYGKMSFCSFIKDSNLRYDLRVGNFYEAWTKFIPSLIEKVRGGEEYKNNCASCKYRSDCNWCPVYGYLEKKRYSAKVKYLCNIAKQKNKYKKHWIKKNRCYYKIADINIQVDSDLEFKASTFDPRLRNFKVKRPNGEPIKITHNYNFMGIDKLYRGEKVRKIGDQTIYKFNDLWIYKKYKTNNLVWDSIAVFNNDHSVGRIYHYDNIMFKCGNLNSICFPFPDYILFSSIFLKLNGFYVRAPKIILFRNGNLLLSKVKDVGIKNSITFNKQGVQTNSVIIRKIAGRFYIFLDGNQVTDSNFLKKKYTLNKIIILLKRADYKKDLFDNEKYKSDILKSFIFYACDNQTENKFLVSLINKILKSIPIYLFCINENKGFKDILRSI
ncbi:MAG: radical SAM/SPASM domain-containing protein [Promethearchaeati archaeon]